MTPGKPVNQKIVGFESKPIPSTTDWPTLGYTAAGVALLVFLFCSYTGTPFLPGVPERDRSKPETRRSIMTRSEIRYQTHLTIEEVIERQKEIARTHQEIYESIGNANRIPWGD